MTCIIYIMLNIKIQSVVGSRSMARRWWLPVQMKNDRSQHCVAASTQACCLWSGDDINIIFVDSQHLPPPPPHHHHHRHCHLHCHCLWSGDNINIIIANSCPQHHHHYRHHHCHRHQHYYPLYHYHHTSYEVVTV